MEGRIAGNTARGGRLQDGKPDVRHAQPAVLVALVIAIVFALVVAVFALVLAVLFGKRQPGVVVTAIGRERQPEFEPGEPVPAAGSERLRRRQPAQHGRWATQLRRAGRAAGWGQQRRRQQHRIPVPAAVAGRLRRQRQPIAGRHPGQPRLGGSADSIGGRSVVLARRERADGASGRWCSGTAAEPGLRSAVWCYGSARTAGRAVAVPDRRW